MRTDRGRRTFYAAGWVISAGVMVVTFRMVLSPTTAKTHVSRAMIKLGARDRAQLVVFAYQAGLVTARASG